MEARNGMNKDVTSICIFLVDVNQSQRLGRDYWNHLLSRAGYIISSITMLFEGP